MCKHKSGGMSKPSGAAVRQGPVNDRTVPTYPSQSVSSESNATFAPMSQDNSIHSQMPTDALFNVQAKTSPLSLMPSGSRNTHLPMETHNCQPKFASSNATVINPVFQNSMFCPGSAGNASRPKEEDESIQSDDSDDENVITELSPMLLSRTFSDNCPQSHFWQTRCGNGNDFISSSSAHRPLSTTHDNNDFQHEGPYILPYVNKCVEFRDYCTQTANDDKSVSHRLYSSGTERNWLFPPSENIQSGQDVNSSDLPLLHVYSVNGNEGGSSPVDSSNSCLTDTYSSSTMNTDPLPGPSGIQRRNSVHWEIGLDSDKEEEFRIRSYSLTPTVNFAVFESESASETEDNGEVFLPTPGELQTKDEPKLEVTEEPFQIPVSSFGKVFPISPSAAQLSLASSYGDSGASICKICHMTAKENDPLISPCRCSGTMQYIHCGCLMRWLEISSKRSRKPASCELCQYQYHWHKKFKVRHWQFPHCSRKDKILHLVFFISMVVMVACATITILCFKQDKGTKLNPDRTELTQSEIITLVCGVTFFLAFFIAMYVEVKSHSTIYKLLVKFIYLNQQWYIDEYEKKESAPVAV